MYRSVHDGPEVELRVKASRFLARAFRADDAATADATVADVRRRFHDASHHCWALRVGAPEHTIERSDDDHEPSGTAGPPILAAISGAGIRDTLVVVTRWFGGTKLGTGGLVRAYGDAAHAALDAAPRRDVWLEVLLVVECAWPDVGAVEAVISREGERVRSCTRAFTGAPRFEVAVVRSRAKEFRDAVREATSGRGRVAQAG